jgi:hypothetical protein
MLQYHYYILIYVDIVMQPLYSVPPSFVTVFFFKIVLEPQYSTKMSLHLPWHSCWNQASYAYLMIPTNLIGCLNV